MKKFLFFIGFLFVLGISIVKSYVKVAPVSTVNLENRDEIIYVIDELPDTISAADYLSRENEDLICSIFSGLVELNERGEPIPDLADGWKISEDGLDYTFKIKKGIYWSDGEEIKAIDFQNYFKELLSPDNENYTSNELNTIYGVKEYREGKSEFSSVAINTLDEYTLKIRMNNKDDNLLKKLAKPIYRLRDLTEPLDNYKFDFNYISYTGAYVIEEVTHDGDVKLKNNSYSDEAYGVNNVVIKEKVSNESELAALTLGKIDVLRNPPVVNSSEFNMYKNINSFLDNEIQLMLINSEREGLKEEIYKILELFIDESLLIKNNIGTKYLSEIKDNNIELLFQKEILSSTGINEEVKTTEYSQDEIKRNLQQIFSEDNKVLRMVIGNGEEEKILAEELEELLEEKFKIKCNIKQYSDDFCNVLSEGKFDIAFIDVDKDKYNTFKREKEIEENSSANENISNLDKESANVEGEDNSKIKSLDKKIKSFIPKNIEILSLYIKNELWCKSEKLTYLYIDGNGNLILKYSDFIE